MKFYMFFGLLFFITTLYSCGTKKDVVATNHSNTTEQDTTRVAPNEIVFLYFRISNRGKDTTSTIELFKKLTKVGNIKSPSSILGLKNLLIIDVFQSEKLAYSFTREHPLYKSVEFYSEITHPEKKFVSLNQQDFVIRLQKKGGVSNTVVISEIREGIEKTKLISIEF